jgi:S1-C subfamily serine protease
VAVIDIGPELRQYFGAPADRGVLVAKVLPGTPAASAGIAVGDVVVDVAGRPVDDAGDVIMAMAAMKDGEQATIRLVRKGAAQSVTATVRDSGAWQLPGPTWWPFRWLDEHWRSLPPAPAPGGRNT